MDLATAYRVIDDITHPDWRVAHQTVLWNLEEQALRHVRAELIDIEPDEPVIVEAATGPGGGRPARSAEA